MLDSITRKVVSSRNLEGLKDEEVKQKWELKEKVNTLKEEKEISVKVNKEQNLKINVLENKVKELTVFKEQVDYLKENMVKVLSTYIKEEQQKDKVNWDFWHEEDLKKLISKNEDKPVEVATEIIEKWEGDVKDHAEAMDRAEAWKNWQKGLLNDEIKTQSLMLKKSDKMLEEEVTKNTKLQEESEGKSKMLARSEEREEELNRQLYLERKPLPSLPKKRNTFQKLGTKIKTKFQKFQQLVEKKKHQAQEFIAQIEVKVN